MMETFEHYQYENLRKNYHLKLEEFIGIEPKINTTIATLLPLDLEREDDYYDAGIDF